MNPAFDVLIDQRYNKYLEASINKNLFDYKCITQNRSVIVL